MTESEKFVGRLLGGFYAAVCSALTDEGAALANETLFQLAESPLIRQEDRRVYQLERISAGLNRDSPEDLDRRISWH